MRQVAHCVGQLSQLLYNKKLQQQNNMNTENSKYIFLRQQIEEHFFTIPLCSYKLSRVSSALYIVHVVHDDIEYYV